ncbi:MAG: hypothetical protein IPJ61_08665 [Tessaracoccus sp.]|uniref:hypothetical protein n=1 Tax=Tessaracoccus sp. TaxID=1971211 RepID=UPI001EBDF3EB|nr:hypothetical protein [Tessaracoccus sp.]MBK7821133.1 hypothetical protein [Tessaracoccus sp.]
MRGGTGAKELAAIRAEILDTEPDEPLLVMTQFRALRQHENKADVIVQDYVDAQVPILNAQYAKRTRGAPKVGLRSRVAKGRDC